MPTFNDALHTVRGCLLALLMIWCGSGWLPTAQAAPAPWYWWASQHDGQRVCAQFMPRQGWRKVQGPFDNAQCQSARKSLISTR